MESEQRLLAAIAWISAEETAPGYWVVRQGHGVMDIDTYYTIIWEGLAAGESQALQYGLDIAYRT